MSSTEEICDKRYVVVCAKIYKEREDVIFFLQYDGNENAIDNLVSAIKKGMSEEFGADGQCEVTAFETEGKMVSESVVNTMCELNFGSTFSKFQKCAGVFTGEPIDWENMSPQDIAQELDDLYYGAKLRQAFR